MALNESNADGAERDLRLDRLYCDAASEAPPAHLDSAILAAARREVRARPRPVSTVLRRWRVPGSIAAVVILSVSLVTLVQKQGGERIVQVTPESPSARPPPALPAQPPPPQGEPEKAPARTATVPPPRIRPAPREDAARRPAAGILGDSAQRDAASTAAQGGAGMAAAPAVAKAQPTPFPDAPGTAERRAAPPPQAAPVEEDLAARAPAAARRGAVPMAAAPASGPARAKVLDRTREEAAAGEEQRPAWHDLKGAPPQKWLDRIGELKRQGRPADADALLAEFKRRFPDHPLPPGGEAR
ncbi:MAG: hypothetical protein HYY78_22460 [Betaproteobacteria bacterium]|nr:hypothetical protein [Betaproteobacteria bacterium]